MTFQEFTGKNVEEAIRTAMREFAADLADLDIEILSQGSRGILGVGGEEARILAAPKSAVASAESLRAPAARVASPPPPASAAGPASAGAELAGEAEEEDPAGDQAEALARAAARERGDGRGGRPRRERGGGFGAGTGTRGRTALYDTPRPERERSEYRRDAPDRPPRAPRRPRADRPERADGEREARPPAAFIPAKPLEELSDEDRSALEQARQVLEDLLRLMSIEASVQVGASAEAAKLNVSGSELGVLIGRRGETLASLQHLVNLIVAKRQGTWRRIAVDVENYRGRREEQLRDVAVRAAKRVQETGKIMQLEPMPALERRIVHVVLAENAGVRTQSVGVEPNRRVVILPGEKAAE